MSQRAMPQPEGWGDQAKPFMTPITLEVCWSRLIGVVNEQANALQRASFSSVVREAGDLSAGVFDRQGRMIAQAVTGTPGHINTMAEAMRAFLEVFPADACKEGDVYITNDPWRSSGHLNDITCCTPVFFEGRLVAFLCSCCHTSDIGGRVLSTEAKDVFEEGLFIPFTKFRDAGAPNTLLEEIIRRNTRTPDQLLGDLDAQVVGGAVGGERLNEFMREFGLEDLEELSEQIIGVTEDAMRAALRRLPDGSHTYEITSDGFDEPIHIRVKVTIAGDAISVDYAGTDAQSRYGINVPLNYTAAYTTYGLKALISPEVPNNEGAFRPLTITAPAGSILNALHPVPVAGRHIIGHFLPFAVFGALAPVLPERTMAEGAASICGVQIRGKTLSGEPFTYVFFIAGGTGARPDSDGLSATGFPSSLLSTPIEVMEAVSPLVVERRSLREGSGGAGRHRGGLGQIFRFRLRTNDPFTCSILCDRTVHAPRGLFGGQDGSRAEIWVDGEKVASPKSEHLVPPGASVEIRMAGGGGYGPPEERSAQERARDFAQGYVLKQ